MKYIFVRFSFTLWGEFQFENFPLCTFLVVFTYLFIYEQRRKTRCLKISRALDTDFKFEAILSEEFSFDVFAKIKFQSDFA